MMKNMLLVLLLAMSSTCSALVVGAAPGAAVSATSSLRTSTPMLKRTAEERDMLELEGTVIESMRGANFRVQLDDTDQIIMAFVSGKIRKNYIKVLVGDKVTCELSPYDLTKGRITFRKR
mmetsp:Transcript_33789/g.88928  ORF Transcript_33789/g.88928 Transcript_33789/m.88928 type:complete len:120 (-) Transcript_33789:354-713(-)